MRENLSFYEVTSLRHEPLHSLRVNGVGPVATLLEMRTDDHRICINVALNVVTGHSRTYKHWNSHRLQNVCKKNKRQRNAHSLWAHKSLR